MKIGIIGPSDSAIKIENCLKKIDSNIQTNLYIRESVENTLEVIEECEHENDGIIFTGCAVAEYLKKNHDIKLPYSFVSRGGTSIMKALWKIRESNQSLDKISIDVIETEVLSDIIEEMEIVTDDLYSRPFSIDIDEQDCINWHIELYESNKTNVMITGYGAVYNELKKKGYPVFRLEPTIPLIKVCYRELKDKYALSKAQYSQIAVEILNFYDEKDSRDSYYSNMIKKSDMDKYIVDYVRNIQGSLFPYGRNEYIIFANKGSVENENNYNSLVKLGKEINNIGFSLNIGIGIGTTSYQAETNARKALKKSIDYKKSDIFMVDEEDRINGPLGSKNKLNYSLIVSDEKVIHISNKTGLSCESIAKLMSLNEIRKNKIYDSKELADCLDISERSARRILQKIIAAEFGRVCAKETSKGGGRPKSLIEILF